MPEYVTPGVYVEEVSFRSRQISGVDLSTAAFIGRAQLDTDEDPDIPVTSYADFESRFGDRSPLLEGLNQSTNYLAHAAQGFFQNGGKRLYVGRIASQSVPAYEAAMSMLEAVEDIGMLALPGYSTLPVQEAVMIKQLMVAHGERLRNRIVILDAPPVADQAGLLSVRQGLDSSYSVLYAPWVTIHDGTQVMALPPSGMVAGVIARVDRERGIHKAPANEVIQGITGFERDIARVEQSVLNPQGVNVLKTLQGRGHRVWGARTLSSDPEWKYLNVRRYAIYLERSMQKGLQWVVFEPNDEPLWRAVRVTLDAFLNSEWRQGALRGEKPGDAYFVQADRRTMTQEDIDRGQLNVIVGVALARPAEFKLLKLQFQTDRSI